MAKSDTNPLTQSEHLYYIHPRLARHSPKPKEEPQPRGKPSPGPRGLNVPAHPKGRPTRRPTAQAKAAISSYQRPGSPSPPPRRWKVHRLCSAGPVQGPCRFNASHYRMRLLRPIACRFTGQVNRPRFSKVLVSLLVPPSPLSVSTTDAPGRRLCSPSAVRSSAAAGGICPTQP